MPDNHQLADEMANLVFNLRQKCAAKDNYFVKTLNISLAEYNCLVQFFQQDSYNVKELAERLDITSGGVTHIITSLEGKGYITRTISPEDRRGINVILTSKGRKIVAQIREASVELHAKILNQIKPRNQKKVLESMHKLNDAIDIWLKEHRLSLEDEN